MTEKRKIEKCNKQNHLTEGRHKLNSHSTSQSNTQLLHCSCSYLCFLSV